ncbi:hypothetical protein QC764_608200 [Podospora pseudoanserina]|uniref:Uncharacterized protein n=1 Tax=Podospora pseudoanserina TaxID=2609844 RepID=A0ABR0HV19_9PEZI|nr:hypothetical protein QC764_608200 [Podospora pseudoanserina]
MSSTSGQRFLICVDYGTTYTGVGWILTHRTRPSQLNELNIVKRWGAIHRPETSQVIGPKVPSIISYSGTSGRRWGYGVIGDADSHILQWTKLEMEPPTRLEALSRLKRTLEATRGPVSHRQHASSLVQGIPLHLIKSTEDVVADYLTEVAQCVRQDIETVQRDRRVIGDFPIELIITHPAIWHPRAMNTTFRAVNTAFKRIFPEFESNPGKVRLTTESEACAQYIMKTSTSAHKRHLRRGACFVVVDAGGGTVDLVSYRVDQDTPSFQVSLVTEMSSGRCGATRIDDYFIKRFLPRRLTPDDYRKVVEDAESNFGSGPHVLFSRRQQAMLESFQFAKHKFAGVGTEDEEFRVLLPGDLDIPDNPERGISNGNLQILPEDMEHMFQETVDGTVNLIRQQITQLEVKNLRVSAVFLSGGLSRSEYLFKKVESEIGHQYRLPVFRGQEGDKSSWTDVVIGAAILGLGMNCEVPPACAECPYHIGVLISQQFHEYENDEKQAYTDAIGQSMRAKDHLKWIAAKGDMITQPDGISKSVKLVRKILKLNDQVLKGSCTVVISHDSKQGDKLEDIRNLQKVQLNYDLATLSTADKAKVIRRDTDEDTKTQYRQVELELVVTVREEVAAFQLYAGQPGGIPIAEAATDRNGQFILGNAGSQREQHLPVVPDKDSASGAGSDPNQESTSSRQPGQGRRPIYDTAESSRSRRVYV